MLKIGQACSDILQDRVAPGWIAAAHRAMMAIMLFVEPAEAIDPQAVDSPQVRAESGQEYCLHTLDCRFS
jgi:hypothetical protein